MTEGCRCIRWDHKGLRLTAIEPSAEDVRVHAGSLADWYNELYNRSMMDNSEPLSAEDVEKQFEVMRSAGGTPFLLFCDDLLSGDADLRRVEPPLAEFAIMVGARNTQGKGLGTAFSIMIHAFAFRTLGLARIYLSIVPANEPGRRCYEKVGYAIDTSAEARRYTDSEDDIAMSLDRATFERVHEAALGQISIGLHQHRSPSGTKGGRPGHPR